MQLAKDWAKVYKVHGYTVLMFGQRQVVGGERKYIIHVMLDLGRYNIGTIQYYHEYDHWLTQKEFDAETSEKKAEAALQDMIKEYNNQMKNGQGEPIKVTYEG